MKKFCLKICLLSALIAVCLIILNALYMRTNSWKWENNVNKFNNVPYGIELANFGSSHGEYDIRYSVIPDLQTFNFALSAQNFFYDFSLLKQYSDHFSKNAVVILPLSYFQISRREQNYATLRKRYYRFLNKALMDKWFPWDNFRYATFPILSAGKNVASIFIDKQDRSLFDTLTGYLEENELSAYTASRINSWSTPEEEKGETGYQENKADLANIITYCLDHSLQPVLISTPITDMLNAHYDQLDGFLDMFYRFSAELCQTYNIPYLDYTHDERFSSHHELFCDSDHLNLAGAEKFTQILVSDLQACGLLQ